MAFIHFLEYAEKHLAGQNFEVYPAKNLESFGFNADLCAKKSGRSLLIFFPYEDFIFIHDFGRADARSKENLHSLHEKSRDYVNSLYRTPKALRYKVPSIITLAVSDKGFPLEVQRYAIERKNSLVGGEKNSVFLIDLANKRVVSQGLETTHVDMVSIRFDTVNPSNRAYHIVCGMAKEFFIGNP